MGRVATELHLQRESYWGAEVGRNEIRLFSGGFMCTVWIDLPYVKRVGEQKEGGGNTSISQMFMGKHLCRRTDEESYVWEFTGEKNGRKCSYSSLSSLLSLTPGCWPFF